MRAPFPCGVEQPVDVVVAVRRVVVEEREAPGAGLGLDTLPTTILYDSQGREVWRMVGMADWQSDRVARLLLEADAG